MRDFENERLMAQGRHPLQSGDVRETARDANIAANGRWGVLAMVAICIAAGHLHMATGWVLLLFGAYFAEQFPHPDQRRVFAWILAAGGFVDLILTGAML